MVFGWLLGTFGVHFVYLEEDIWRTFGVPVVYLVAGRFYQVLRVVFCMIAC